MSATRKQRNSAGVSHSVDVIGVTVFAALGLFVWLSTVARRGGR